MSRRPRNNSYNYDRDDDYDNDNYRRNDRRDDYMPPNPPPEKKKNSLFNATTIAILAGIFILGIGVGIAFNTVTPTQNGVLVNTVQLDEKAPNADVCIQNGASAMSVTARLYVTLNPFKVFVAQAGMEPACVLRQANWAVLEQRKLLTSEQVRECRQRLNTFGYVGSLDNKPTIDCVYQSDNAKNLFVGTAGDAPSIDGQGKF